MKCPYRINEVHSCHNGRTYIYKEFAECYEKTCPYFVVSNVGNWCRKDCREVGGCKAFND